MKGRCIKMRSKIKGLFIGAILGVGAGLVINKILGEKSVDEIKENIEKVKKVIGEYKKENTFNMKIDI